MTSPIVFLVDNGSLRPQATFFLRSLADSLAKSTVLPVEAVSLLHSHKIPADELAGVPATIVKRRLRECLAAGQREFIILPLFLGPSLAVTDYLPKVVDELSGEYPQLKVRIASVIAGDNLDLPDPRLAQILADQIRALQPSSNTKLALVDHGTPIIEVNRVRNAVGRQLASELGASVVLPCSMERREGEAYAFNDPLLEKLGEVDDFAGGRLILAMFFLLPGRHAGEGGDVAEICNNLISEGVFEQIQNTPLLGEHPMLLEILKDRLRDTLSRNI
ncbi:MAG: CbiX/SirB N-terminal domain-containing protein [Verrucomicrobiota bacterium]|nr:CbiX/SirB N-terminal domain-containing protein [Verrucomicrobiota bacterium]